MANIYGRQVVVPMTNKSGGGVIAGDVVIIDTANNAAFTTTTSAGYTGMIGIVQETIAVDAIGRVLTSGYAALVNVNATVTRGNFGKTHTVAKQATDAGAARIAGTFCQFLTGGTTPTAMMYPVDLAGAALTNPMDAIGQMIGGTTAGAPAKITAGTAGQFIMSNGAAVPAFASRELDYAQSTADTNITATTEAAADTVVTGASVAYNGSTIVIIEFYCPDFHPAFTSNAWIRANLFEDGSSIGHLGIMAQPTFTPSSAVGVRAPAHFLRRLTPTNASHTYSIRCHVSSGTGVAGAGAGGVGANVPAFLRITRAV